MTGRLDTAKMKRALIFGITGQDGSYLARYLLSKGYKVYGTSRGSVASKQRNLVDLGVKEEVSIKQVAITDFTQVFNSIKEVSPHEIYNTAGISSVGPSFEQPMETHQSIYLGTLNMLESIRLINKEMKFFSAGSSECFGDTKGDAADESTPFRPRNNPYGAAKAASFFQVANYRELYDLFCCTGILFNHESPLRPRQLVTKKIVVAACLAAGGSREKLHLGDLSIIRDWGWAPEYVEVMWLMLQQDRPDDFVIATGESNSLEVFVDRAFSCFGLDWREYVVIDKELFRPIDTKIFKANPAKAKRQLSWSAQFKMDDVIHMMIQAEQKLSSAKN